MVRSIIQNADSILIHNKIHKIMENLKLISVRIEPETLRLIDKFVKQHDYYRRSSVINNILSAVVKCSDKQTLWKIISTWKPENSGYDVTFKVSEKKLGLVKGRDV